MVRGHTTFASCSTARTWRPVMRRAARLCSTPARPAASCVQTSSSSTAAQERAAVLPPRPARPPPPALQPRPARGAGAVRPAWAAWTPRSRWYSCPAAGETPPPPPRGQGTTAPGGPLDRCTHSPLQSAPRPTGALSIPTRAQPRTPPRRHKLTSLSPARHGDPSSRPYNTASLL